MPHSVFTYGSLMFPPVWERVVRGQYSYVTATLAGHARRAIHDETYPGMIVASQESVTGVVYFDVSAADVKALDAFEGADYRRVPVVVTLDSGTHVAAHTYLYLPTHRLSDLPWNPEAFDMSRFIASYCRERLGAREG